MLLLSGFFDLEPLTLLPIGRLFGLNARLAAKLSPVRRAAPAGMKIGLAVGDAESDEFKRQSELMAAAWHAPKPLICRAITSACWKA